MPRKNPADGDRSHDHDVISGSGSEWVVVFALDGVQLLTLGWEGIVGAARLASSRAFSSLTSTECRRKKASKKEGLFGAGPGLCVRIPELDQFRYRGQEAQNSPPPTCGSR